MTTKVCRLVFWMVCLVAGLLSSPPAWATRPGFNGSLAYVQSKAIYVDGQNLSQPPEDAIDSSPAWSPDGQQIAFVRSSFRIYVMNADGSNLRLLVTSAQPNEPGSLPRGFFSSVGWSANGLDVTFMTSEQPTGPYLRWRVTVAVPHLVTGGGEFHRAGEPERDILEREKEVYACQRGIPEICIRDGGTTYIDLTEELPGLQSQQGNVLAQVFTPQWQPTNIEDFPRILLAATVYPEGDSLPRRELYSISYYYNPASGAGAFVVDTRRLTTSTYTPCGAEGSEPLSMLATEYYTPVPSPDGRFFVAEKWTRAPDCSVTKNLYRFDKEGSQLEQVGSQASQPAWQPKQAQLGVNVETTAGHPIDGAEVTIRSTTGDPIPDVTTDTAEGGGYLFNGLLPGNYRIRVTLKNPAFEIHHDYPSTEPVWVERIVTFEDSPTGMKFRFTFASGEGVESSMGNSSDDYRLSYMAGIFRNLHRFTDWVKDNMAPLPNRVVPFYTFATQKPSGDPLPGGGAIYHFDAQAVWMGTNLSAAPSYLSGNDHGFENNPENAEWHEFTHSLFDIRCNDGNHLGYANPTTCDSLHEGFASFLAAWANAEHDTFYADFSDLEWHQKAWGSRFSGHSPPFDVAHPPFISLEDLSVAALLWDIVDTAADVESTNVISESVLGGSTVHLPASFRDDVSVPLPTLWQILTSSGATTVHALRLALNVLPEFSDLTIDLDDDGIMDISVGDQLFLMHGFFPIQNDQTVSGDHRSYHYNVLGGSEARNETVGLSSHSLYNFEGYFSPTWIPRFNLEVAPNANLRVDMRDASGTPLKAADLQLSIAYPGDTRTVETTPAEGAGTLVHLELPNYFDHVPDGLTLPSCDPGSGLDLEVEVVASATVNGYAAENTFTFDSCQYLDALFASTGDSALSIAFQFPEDSDVPEATRVVRPFGGSLASHRPNLVIEGVWIVALSCDDPVVGEFATGCLPIEYRLDDGAWQRYDDEFDVRTPGLHVLEVRAQDRAGNVASIDPIELGIIAQFDSVAPVTTSTAVPSVPPIGGYTAGIWHVTLSCVDHNTTGPNGTENIPSGCVTTEYSIDGAPFATYQAGFDVTGPGEHIVAYRSVDLMNNAESAKSSVLRIAGPDTTPPATSVDFAVDPGAYLFGDGAMSSFITFTLGFCTDGNAGPEQIHSGCATTEYALDGSDFAPFGEPVVVTQPGPHTFSWRSTDVAGNVAELQSVTLTLVAPVDEDGDTIVDWYDNCLNVPNADQQNVEGDRFGDACDADFNGNYRVDSRDASLLKSRLGSSDPWNSFLDLSGDGVVDAQDMAIIKMRFGKPPGPAGLAVFGGGN